MPGPRILAVAVTPAFAGGGSDGTETPTGAERQATMAGESAGSPPTRLPRGSEPVDMDLRDVATRGKGGG